METYELRYFLGVARFENIHRASERLRISPASLSKAVARLESEFQVKLFSREGRGIRLTGHGRLLQLRGSELIFAEEGLRLELQGAEGSLAVGVAGPEVLLSKFGPQIAGRIEKSYPNATFDFLAGSEADARAQVERGEAHLGLASAEPPPGFSSTVLGDCLFRTCVGPGHPLFAAARSGKKIPVERVLQHSFASPMVPIFGLFRGQPGAKQSVDGWRDDPFPRKIAYRTSSIKTLEDLVASGKAVAYLPDYFLGEGSRLAAITLSGCPYSCRQEIRLLHRKARGPAWVSRIFG